jgi:hypothetical protein
MDAIGSLTAEAIRYLEAGHAQRKVVDIPTLGIAEEWKS